MWNLSKVEVEAASKEAEGVLALDSGVFKHSHTTASKKLNYPVKVVFTLLQNTLSGYDICISLCECSVHISLSSITTHSVTD